MATETEADYLVEKIAGLRIFEDGNGKVNRSVADLGGLAVSQFILYGDARRGKRPSFDDSRSARARPRALRVTSSRRFGSAACTAKPASSKPRCLVSLVNLGPVKLLLDRSKLL